MIQAEWREKQVLIGISFVHCVEEVGGEDCEAFVEISRLVLELCVLLDVLGEAKLSAGIGKGCKPDEHHEKTAEHFHLVYLKTIMRAFIKLCPYELLCWEIPDGLNVIQLWDFPDR